MKYLLLLVVVVVGLYLMLGRRKSGDASAPPPPPPRPEAPPTMLACARCGVHVPRDEALTDAVGRAYCGEPHRLAGPR